MFNLKSRKSMKKTWSMILKVIIAVAGAIAGVIGVQAATMILLFEKIYLCRSEGGKNPRLFCVYTNYC